MNKEIVTVTNTPSGMEDLIAASERLLNATEQQFESIRKEKWFNRVFDMITFSQKKTARLGEQIQTLSQAQNIILQILPRMAAEHAEVAAYISEERDRIEYLTQNDLTLLRLYKNLYQRLENERLGIKKTQDIGELSEIDKLALSSCLRMLSQKFEETSSLQQLYFNEIHNYIDCESEGEISWNTFCERPENVRKQVLQCCLEYVFLYHNGFDLNDELLEFIDNFDLGSKTVRERQSLVIEMFHARGAEGIIGKYQNTDIFEDIPDTFVIEYDETVNEEIGYYANNQRDDISENSFEWHYRLAVNGDPDAQCHVGICYYNGDGVEKNIQTAIEWYRKAAEQGHADAQNRLGVRYDNGDGVEEDSEIAVEWFQKAAEQGHAKAQCNLGKHFYDGDGVSEDNVRAFYWFHRAALQNIAEAQYYLGLCYLSGYGTNEDDEQAIYWFKTAAEQGHSSAQFLMGLSCLREDGKKLMQIKLSIGSKKPQSEVTLHLSFF